MRSNLHASHVGAPGAAQSRRDQTGFNSARPADKQTEPHRGCRGADNFRSNAPQGKSVIRPPSIEADRLEHHVAGAAVGQGLGNDENRHPGGMVGPLHEWQPGDDLGRLPRREAGPPGVRPGSAVDREHAEIPGRSSHGLNDVGCAEMGHTGDGEAKMEPRGIAHRGVAARYVDMHAVRRLHIGEGRDDDPPDALDRVQRQQPAVPLHDRPHHRRLASRSERRAATLLRLDLDQLINDPPALDQELVHRRVDSVDLAAQVGQSRLERSAIRHGLAPLAFSPKLTRRQVFIDSKKLALVLVSRSFPSRNSMASTVPIGLRMRLRTYIFLRMSEGTSSSSLRVPERVMSIAGKVRLSATLRSRMISELPVPLNSSKITSSMRDPVSISAVAMIVSDPPSSIFRAAPKNRFGRCNAFESTPPESTFPDGGTMVLYARARRVIESSRITTSRLCSTSRFAFSISSAM